MKKIFEVHYTIWISDYNRTCGSRQFSTKATAEKFRRALNATGTYKGQELYSVSKAVEEREIK